MSAMLEEDAREMLEVGFELDSPEIVRRVIAGGLTRIQGAVRGGRAFPSSLQKKLRFG